MRRKEEGEKMRRWRERDRGKMKSWTRIRAKEGENREEEEGKEEI